jgi:hypothetical protein
VNNENSVGDIFRFTQLRPRLTFKVADAILLADSTALAKDLAGAPTVVGRAAIANATLKAGSIRGATDTPLGSKIITALSSLASQQEATTKDLANALPELAGLLNANDFAQKLQALPDTLLAAYFATRDIPGELDALQAIYRVYNLPPSSSDAVSLARFMRFPLIAPAFAAPSPGKAATSKGQASDAPARISRAEEALPVGVDAAVV